LDGAFETTMMLSAAVSLPKGHIYLIGGETLDGLTRTGSTLLYSSSFANPLPKASLPQPTSQGCAVLVDEQFIYYIGGLGIIQKILPVL